MDPTATLQRMNDARDEDELIYAAEDLVEWFDQGGFEPDWTVASRRTLNFWREYLAAQRIGSQSMLRGE